LLTRISRRTAELGQRAFDHLADRIIARDVDRDAEHSPAPAAQRATRIRVARRILAGDHHIGALGQQLGRAGAADAAARACDDGDASLEAEVHVRPFVPRMHHNAERNARGGAVLIGGVVPPRSRVCSTPLSRCAAPGTRS